MSALCLPVKKRSGFVRWHCGHTFDFELDAVDAREEDGFMLGGWQWGRKEWKILLQFLTSPAFHFSSVFATLFLCRVQRRFHHEIAAHNSFCFIGPRRGITRLWNTMSRKCIWVSNNCPCYAEYSGGSAGGGRIHEQTPRLTTLNYALSSLSSPGTTTNAGAGDFFSISSVSSADSSTTTSCDPALGASAVFSGSAAAFVSSSIFFSASSLRFLSSSSYSLISTSLVAIQLAYEMLFATIYHLRKCERALPTGRTRVSDSPFLSWKSPSPLDSVSCLV